MSFEKIIGHDFIKKQIQGSIQQKNFSHAHLIIGEDGIGKSLIAKETALRLLDKHENRDYVDIIEWKVMKNKQSIGVDEVRDIIREVNKKPYEGDKKIIIVYESHKMTIEAQNAFLKTIEEPPKGVTIILLSESLGLILETIRSRCQIHKLKRLSSEEIREYLLREYPDLELDKVRAVTAFSDGIPGRCQLFLEDNSFIEIRDISLDILLQINKKEKSIVKKYEKFFYRYSEKWEEIISSFNSYIRDIIIYKDISKKELIINSDKIENIQQLSNMYSFNELYGMFELIDETKQKLDRRVNSALAFQVMLLKMQEV
ncbi:DNA polymerase III subunit delta' [Clostridium sp. MB40-C1]|uniref:DNA polymerase III subunit delta' n=1 Tax=Clostridium sp. MB40-C1 TaxID=3070996 RepID=UPI0027E175DD|nr:DNA polymerase III subunit delta' [Clostridium sp. MB40-C1]WMJ79985.1 DNA polymerase III subunit delta' [Clostridium sp. MB40-C1]